MIEEEADPPRAACCAAIPRTEGFAMKTYKKKAIGKFKVPSSEKGPRPFLIDSGATYHLIGRDKLTEEEKKHQRVITNFQGNPEPIHLQTANGISTATHT